jgi:hypothetical protein
MDRGDNVHGPGEEAHGQGRERRWTRERRLMDRGEKVHRGRISTQGLRTGRRTTNRLVWPTKRTQAPTNRVWFTARGDV